MTKADQNYIALCEQILQQGWNTHGEKVRPKYADGTDSHTLYTTQVMERYDLDQGEFPILTLRPIAWKNAIKEILWIYKDQSNSLDVLEEKYDIHWWNEWDVGDRTIGQRYGATVKRYDLMNRLLRGLEEQPYGRRHIINLYQYHDFSETDGLYPCAMETHWSVREDFLDMTLIQRSSDLPVANAINKVQYTALLMAVAQHLNRKPGVFCHYTHNVHIYDRHIDAVKEMIQRKGQSNSTEIALQVAQKPFFELEIDDFQMIHYHPEQPNFKFEMAI